MLDGATVALYRFRATFRQRWPGLLAIVLLLGLVGGLAMGSIAGVRRTQSSYPTFLASTDPSNLTVSAGSANSSGSSDSGELTTKIAHLAGVQRVRDLVAPTVIPLAPNGAPRVQLADVLQVYGSQDGELLNQDRMTTVQGRMANPKRADEIVMTANAAQILGVHVGQVVPLGFYTNAQTELPGFGTPSVDPRLRVQAKLMGIVVLNNQVVQDDVDRAYGFLLLTPALIRKAATISPEAPTPVLYALQLDHGGRDVAAVEKAFIRAVPPNSAYEIHVTSRVVTDVELVI